MAIVKKKGGGILKIALAKKNIIGLNQRYT